MKNKKGFTLVELLAILVILGIIAGIAVINIGRQASQNEKQNKKILDQKIINASKIYAAKYYSNKIITGEEFSFSINKLIEDGVLHLGNKECTNKRIEEIVVQGNRFDYTNVKDDDCYSK